MKYRMKLAEIEAVQWTGGCYKVEEPQWLIQAIVDHIIYFPAAGQLCISTPGGSLTVDVGDYIIRDAKGEIYPCKPDIFEQTYAPDSSFRP